MDPAGPGAAAAPTPCCRPGHQGAHAVDPAPSPSLLPPLPPGSLLLPFRSQPPAPRLPQGYQLSWQGPVTAAELDRLLSLCAERPRGEELWQKVLRCSAWCVAIRDQRGQLVGFLRATSDQALNANLWDLLSDPGDPARDEVIHGLVHAALQRLRKELGGCSVSVAAPPEALEALRRVGFVVDPGGIRAMGLELEGPGPWP